MTGPIYKSNIMIPDEVPLQQKLGYRFNDQALFREALRHSSYANEHPDEHIRDNERLEFLGDAVLNLVIGDVLMRTYPDLHEGDLSRIRASLVNETRLADLARHLGIGEHLKLGKGEMQSNGREKNSILANAVEAIIAAVYLDGGFEAAQTIIHCHFEDLIDAAPDLAGGRDYKSRLQEAVQGRTRETPLYQVVEESGPDHDKTFHVAMRVGEIRTRGVGKSKKAAEQDAARRGLAAIKGMEE